MAWSDAAREAALAARRAHMIGTREQRLQIAKLTKREHQTKLDYMKAYRAKRSEAYLEKLNSKNIWAHELNQQARAKAGMQWGRSRTKYVKPAATSTNLPHPSNRRYDPWVVTSPSGRRTRINMFTAENATNPYFMKRGY